MVKKHQPRFDGKAKERRKRKKAEKYLSVSLEKKAEEEREENSPIVLTEGMKDAVCGNIISNFSKNEIAEMAFHQINIFLCQNSK